MCGSIPEHCTRSRPYGSLPELAPMSLINAEVRIFVSKLFLFNVFVTQLRWKTSVGFYLGFILTIAAIVIRVKFINRKLQRTW